MTQDNIAGSGPAEQKKMKPIWYFCGLMLIVIGLLLVLSGVINLVSPPKVQTVLYQLHTNLWWGAVITIGGLALVLINRKGTG